MSGDAESASIPVPGHTAPPPDPVQRQDTLTTAESGHLAGGHFQTGTDVPLSLWWLVLSGAFSVHLLCTAVLLACVFNGLGARSVWVLMLVSAGGMLRQIGTAVFRLPHNKVTN